MELDPGQIDQIAQSVGGIGAAALAWVAWKLRPLLRLLIRLQLDTRRKVRRLEAALDQGSTDGTNRPRTVTPQPDELERAAERVLQSSG